MVYLLPAIVSGALFSAAILSPLLPVTSAYNLARWILLAATLSLLALPALMSGQKTVSNGPFRKLLSGLLFIAFISSLASTYIHSTDGHVNGYLFLGWELLFIMALVVTGKILGDSYYRRTDISRLITVVSLVAVVVMALYSVTVIMGVSFWYSGVAGQLRDYVPSGFYNIRFWSQCSTWLMPLAILCASEMRLKGRYGFYGLCLMVSGIWVMTAFISGARGHLLAILLSGLVLGISYRKGMSDLARQSVIILVVGCTLYLLLAILIPAMALEQGNAGKGVVRAGLSGRGLLWMVGLESSIQTFPLGEGALSYSGKQGLSYAHPHSVYIRWAAEYGWLALVAFVGALLLWAYPAWKQLKQISTEADSRAFLAIYWSCLAAVIHASVSGVFAMPHSLLAGMPVMILFVALVERRPTYPPSAEKLPFWKRLRLLPVLALGMLMVHPTYNWYRASEEASESYMEDQGVPLGPRFWLHGRYVD